MKSQANANKKFAIGNASKARRLRKNSHGDGKGAGGTSALAEEGKVFPLIPEEGEGPSEAVAVTVDEEMVVPDGGWGWLVAFGSFIIMTLILQLSPCFGILFSRYLLERGASSMTTAWIFNMECFLLYVMGLIVSPLCKEFGWKRVGILGSILTSVSLIISAFSPTPEFLFFSFSAMSGIGSGLAVCMCFIILPMYFDRRRGIANAIMMAGICMGEIIGPPLIRYLQDEYTFKGATLIFGAIVLHGCVGASFFHPVEWHMKKQPVESNTKEEDLESKVDIRAYNRVTSTASLGLRHVYSDLFSIKRVPSGVSLGFPKTLSGVSLRGANKEQEDEGSYQLPARRAKRPRYISECSYDSIPSFYNSTLSISSLALANHAAMSAMRERERKLQGVEERDEGSSLKTQLIRFSSSVLSDMKILTKSMRAATISAAHTFYSNGYMNYIMMVPFLMQASGYTLQDCTYCLSVAATCNLVARLVISLLSDWSRFNMRHWYIGGHIVMGIAMMAFPMLPSLTWMVADMVMLGVGIGSTASLNTLIIIDTMGLEQLPPVYGASCLTVGVGFIVFGPAIGSIRDATDSYLVSMWICSGIIWLSCLLWVLMPIAMVYDAKKESKDDPDDEERGRE